MSMITESEAATLPVAFVIMPFDPEFDAYFNDFIKPTLEDAGFDVQRADSQLHQQNILKTIIQGLAACELVVADLSAANPNVFYELGISHAKGKKTVLITQSIEELPFDLRSYTVIPYSTHYQRLAEFRTKLHEIARGALEGGVEFGSPVDDFWAGADLTLRAEPEREPPPTIKEPADDELSRTEEGVWDWAADVDESMSEATELLNLLAAETRELGAKVTEGSERIASLKDSREAGTARKVRMEIAKVAQDMIRFNGVVEKSLVPFHDAWSRVERSTVSMLNYAASSRTSEEDLTAIKGYRDVVADLADKAASTIESLETFQASIRKLRGTSRDLNYASEKSAQKLGELVDEVRIIESICQRIIALSDDVLDNRTRANDSDPE